MLHVREAEANYPEADTRPPDAALDDAADHSTGSDAQGADGANLQNLVVDRNVFGSKRPFSPYVANVFFEIQLSVTSANCHA
jgi:hypothetical protein